MQKFIIAPSILSADFSRLGEEVETVLKAGADMIHFDVMDNHYVPNLTIGPLVCEALRKYGIKAPIDVHLMTRPVDRLIVDFAKAGATYITFHADASENIDRSLQLIIDYGCKAGLAFNPQTPVEISEQYWKKLSMIVLMSVNPGFAGQKFIENILPKISQVCELINHQSKLHHCPPPLLEIDGGINLNNVQEVALAGADVLVMGSAIFSAQENYKTTIAKVRKMIG